MTSWVDRQMLPGVTAAVNFAAERAHVEFKPDSVTTVQLVDTVRKAGYDVPLDSHT